jgi:hypothetical protein
MNRKTMAIAGALTAAGLCAMILPSRATLEMSPPNPVAHATAPDGIQVAARGGGGRGGGGGGGARGGGGFSGGGGARDVRGGSMSSVNSGVARNGNFSRGNLNGGGAAGGGRYAGNGNLNGNGNFNGNTINRNNVVVNGGGYGGYGGYGGGWDDHPIAAAAAITGAAIATAAVVGSVVNAVPAGCGTVMVNGFSYYQCGSAWYQPQYAGSSVQYVVVNAPQ